VLNLHFALQEMRAAGAAAAAGKSRGYDGGGEVPVPVPGPRVLVCGERACGKTTVARTLAALATRGGGQPLVASVDPREGMLALPGTVSAAVFGTVMDVEDPAGGFGVSGTPSSGPSAVPVKLPMVYYFGRERVEEDVPLWKDLVGKLGSSVRAKFAADETVREAGMVLDTPAASVAKGDMDILAHVVNEFAGELARVLIWVCGRQLTVGSEYRRCPRLGRHPHGVTAPVGESTDGTWRAHHRYPPRQVRWRVGTGQGLYEVYSGSGY
jgi:polyribonucleotide 5'-hydroxyl-kinase